jgi:hypothetical protein
MRIARRDSRVAILFPQWRFYRNWRIDGEKSLSDILVASDNPIPAFQQYGKSAIKRSGKWNAERGIRVLQISHVWVNRFSDHVCDVCERTTRDDLDIPETLALSLSDSVLGIRLPSRFPKDPSSWTLFRFGVSQTHAFTNVKVLHECHYIVGTIRYGAKIVFTLIVKLPHADVTRAVLIERSATHKKASLPERREHRTKVPSRYSSDPFLFLSLNLQSSENRNGVFAHVRHRHSWNARRRLND